MLQRDAERFVGGDAGETGHVGDVCLCVVLTRRGPATDDRADGVKTVLVIVRPCEQIESCPPAESEGQVFDFQIISITVPLISHGE